MHKHHIGTVNCCKTQFSEVVLAMCTLCILSLSAEPQVAFTHFPGSMFITDQLASRKPLDSPPRVVQLSRKDAPFFASVLGETTYKLFSGLEQALLEDPGGRGVAHLFQVMLYYCVASTTKLDTSP